jgi:HEPN domain-containing protein
VDLMLVVPDDAAGERRGRDLLTRIRQRTAAPLDIVLTCDSRFDSQCHWINGLVSEVYRTGELLHTLPGAAESGQEPSPMVPEDFAAQAQSWLQSAASNLRSGDVLLNLDPPESVVALGHAEQCCERCCKALLAAAGRKVPHTHALPKLHEELREAGLEPPMAQSDGAFISGLQELHRYGAENVDLAELPVEDAQRALAIARACLAQVKTALSV